MHHSGLNSMSMGEYQMCTRCVMDTTAEAIVFDAQGVCNFCSAYDQQHFLLSRAEHSRESKLREFISSVKSDGVGKPYDCIVGVSGGVDSSWVLVNTVQLGLRPLAVHLDNGWNSELAQQNIEALVKGLKVDLQTTVLDWSEFRDLQEAFFDADVIDIELLTDNFLAAVNYEAARKWGIRHILSGSNLATEGIPMPRNWAAVTKFDRQNILGIWRAKGRGYRLSNVPVFSLNAFYINRYIRRIVWHRFLDLLPYRKDAALAALKRDYGFVPYPYKHYESVFTRLYQGLILPRKFGVDKRKNHLSALIMGGELTRSDALSALRESPYASEAQLKSDVDYFLKKFNWTPQQFELYLSRPAVPHSQYGNDIDWLGRPRMAAKKMWRALSSSRGGASGS